VTISRPGVNGATPKRIEVSLVDETNGIDCAKDVLLEFGDVVEIPERGHTLAEQDNWIGNQAHKARQCLEMTAGEVRFVLVGGGAVQLPLKGFTWTGSYLGIVLRSSEAQNILTSGSDLSRLKVTRRDSKTGKSHEWILDCSNERGVPDLVLRDGDVIEVPQKP